MKAANAGADVYKNQFSGEALLSRPYNSLKVRGFDLLRILKLFLRPNSLYAF
jgi:hypothetical protein